MDRGDDERRGALRRCPRVSLEAIGIAAYRTASGRAFAARRPDRPFGTIAADVDPHVDPDPRIAPLPAAEIRAPLRRVLRRARPHGRAQRRASCRPATRRCSSRTAGMVQFKDVLTGAETRSLHPGGRLPALPARRRQAQRLRGGRPDAAPPHVLRDARQLELRRLLQARGDPLGVGVPDPRPRASRRTAWPRRPTRTTTSPGTSGATRSACRPSGWPAGATSTHGDEKNFWRMAETGPCGPCSEIHFDRGAHLSEGPHCIPDHTETLPALARDLEPRVHGVRPAPGRPRPAAVHRASTPGMGLERLASVLQQVPTNYDTDLFTPIHARMRELLGHDPDAFEAERFSYQVIADHSRAVTFLDRRRRPALERGPRLRPAPDPAPRGPPRPAARPARAVPGRRRPTSSSTSWPRPTRTSSSGGTRSSAAIAREEAQFARTLDAGTRLLEEALARR